MKMINNHGVIRTCVVTKKHFEKKELIRIALLPNKKNAQLDLDQNLLGRGLYFQNKIEIVNELINKRIVNKIFKLDLDNSWYLDLKKQLITKNNLEN